MTLSAHERERLERLLGAHVPVDAEEEGHLARILEFCARQADPFDRTIAEDHLTGSAFVVDPRGMLLLTHHRRLGIWVQLGGHADAERLAEQVALREAREESGLADLSFSDTLLFDDATPRLLDVDVHLIPARGTEPAHHHLDLRFLLETHAPEQVVRDARESKALEWVALDEAERRGDPGMRRAIGRLRALLHRASRA